MKLVNKLSIILMLFTTIISYWSLSFSPFFKVSLVEIKNKHHAHTLSNGNTQVSIPNQQSHVLFSSVNCIFVYCF